MICLQSPLACYFSQPPAPHLLYSSKTSPLATFVAASNTDEEMSTAPLSPVFLDHLQTLFSLLDGQNTGRVSLQSIESNWARGVAGLPSNFLPCLYQVASSDGHLSFTQFVRGVRLAMTTSTNADVMSKSWTEPSQQQRRQDHHPQQPPSYSTYMNMRPDGKGVSQHTRPPPTRSALSFPRTQTPVSNSTVVAKQPPLVIMRKSVTLDPATLYPPSSRSQGNNNNNNNRYPVNNQGKHNKKTVTMADSHSCKYSNGPDLPPRPASSLMLRTKPQPPPRTVSQHHNKEHLYQQHRQPRRPVSCHPSLGSPVKNGGSGDDNYAALRHPTPSLLTGSSSLMTSTTAITTSSITETSQHTFRTLHFERRALKDCLVCLEKARARLQCRLDSVNERLTVPTHHNSNSNGGEAITPSFLMETSTTTTTGGSNNNWTGVSIMQSRVEQACHLLLALSSDHDGCGPNSTALSRSNSRVCGLSSTPPNASLLLTSSSSVEAELREQVDGLTKEVGQCKLSIRQLEREKSCLVRELFDQRRAPSVLSSSLPLSTDI